MKRLIWLGRHAAYETEFVRAHTRKGQLTKGEQSL